jgi:hypothetical protein
VVALALFLAWTAVGPLQAVLGVAPAGALALLVACGWSALVSGRDVPAGLFLGILAGIAPPSAGGVLALVALSRLRAALAGVGAAAGALAVRLVAMGDGAIEPASLWGTPHLDNTALAGFYARLFAGAGSLTAPPAALGSAPAPPAVALQAGALVAGAVLLVAAARRAGGSDLPRPLADATAAVLGVVGGLLLGGTAPPAYLAAALVALAPAALPAFWHGLGSGARALVAALLVGGYALAGTSHLLLARAATELLSAWPPAASLPALGLLLLAAALAWRLSIRSTGVGSAVQSA